tara:strand:+ start:1093 stop:2109 length:1017 start_codon:yes stop_codon:yes gene_type:complete
MKRGENSWQVSVTYKGVRHRVTVHDESKIRLAKEIVLNALRDGRDVDEALQQQNLFFKPNISINAIYTQVVKRYWENKDSKQVGNGKQIVNFFGANKDISNIDESAVEEMVEHFQDNGNSNATVNRKLAALSKMLTYAKRKKHITHTPYIEWLKEGNSRIRWVDEIEETKMNNILRHAEKHKFADMCTTLIDTGLRRSELRRAKTKDISTSPSGDKLWTQYDTKNDLVRTIPLTTRVQAIVNKYHNVECPFGDMTDHRIRADWDFLRNRMGLTNDKQFVLHTLRHTCASRLVQRGIPILVVKEWLGHKTLTMTLRYAHLAPDNLLSAVKVLEQEPLAS